MAARPSSWHMGTEVASAADFVPFPWRLLSGHIAHEAPFITCWPSAMARVWASHLRTLLWKNFRLRRRRPCALAVELSLPLVLFVFLAWVRTQVPTAHVPIDRTAASALPSAGVLSAFQSYLCDGTDYDGNPAQDFDIPQEERRQVHAVES